MQAHISHEPDVRPSVCRLNSWIVRKQKKHVPTLLLYTTWKIIYPSFLTKRMVGGGHPFYMRFWVKLTPLERKRRFSINIRSLASAVTPREKYSINTNRKSTTRFPMSLRWTSYAAPKPQRGRFPFKLRLLWKKVCYKVSLCENRQRQSCKAWIALSILSRLILPWCNCIYWMTINYNNIPRRRFQRDQYDCFKLQIFTF